MINDIHCKTYTPIIPLCNLVKDRIEANDTDIYPGTICQSCVYGKDAEWYSTVDPLTSLAVDPQKTFDSLSTAFVARGRINERDLNDSVITIIKTDKDLQYQLSTKRMRPEQVVWKALAMVANECLALDYPRKYTVTTEHLQQWLTQYGRGYDTLKAALDYAEKA